MFAAFHPLVGACGEGTRSAYVNTQVVGHMSYITQLLVVRIAVWHTLAVDEFQVYLVLLEAWQVVLEIHRQIVSLLLWHRYPS